LISLPFFKDKWLEESRIKIDAGGSGLRPIPRDQTRLNH